eukprot:jgi/Chrzof1/4918/Cz15g04140.t1
MDSKDRVRSSKRRSRSESPDSSASSGSQDHTQKKHKHKHKHKSKKSKKHHSSKDKELIGQAKAYLKQHLKGVAGGDSSSKQDEPGSSQPPGQLPVGVHAITSDHYFEKSGEFTAWLQHKRAIFFNDLSTEESHKLFDEFVAEWNAGKLPLKYYQGLVEAPKKRTPHQWNFKGGSGGGTGMKAFLEDEQDRTAGQRTAGRLAEQQERRKWRADQKDVLDELLPKATGREAKVEQRVARREAARACEDSPDLVRVTGGGDVMGGGDDDSFAAAKAREARRQDWRSRNAVAKQEVLSAKLAAQQAAEDEKMAPLRALVGMGPIVIPKRQ